MKAYLHCAIKCPYCGYIMIVEDNVVYCANGDCENYKVEYKQPMIELEKNE